jgi:hypothetical protein
MREKRIKEAAFAVLAKRNHELQLIKDGELMPKKPRVMTLIFPFYQHTHTFAFMIVNIDDQIIVSL